MTPETVLLSFLDRAPQLTMSDDRLGVSGNKFYCTIRANHSVNRGTWYFEAKIVDLPEGAATRIGWAQKNANLQADSDKSADVQKWPLFQLLLKKHALWRVLLLNFWSQNCRFT